MAFHGVDGNLIRTRLEEAKKGEGTGERSDCLRLDPLWSLTEAKTRLALESTTMEQSSPYLSSDLDLLGHP